MSVVAIIDDDAGVVRAMARLLTTRGIEALTFCSGKEFLDFIKQPPQTVLDCIILDVNMDGINGLEVQRHLLESGTTTPIVFVSSAVDSHVHEQAIAAGAVAFFNKPFDADALIDSIQRTISSRGDPGA
jgi:FixJ family two-component response regulator